MEMNLPLVFILLFFLPLLSSSAFTPNNSYFLDCGSSSTTQLQSDNPGRDFVPDLSYLTPTSNSISISNTSSTSSPLSTTARVFTSAATYKFSINSVATHIIRLHFYPFSTQYYTLSAARFNVSTLNGLLLLSDFSTKNPIIKEYFLWVDTDTLVITFTPNSPPSPQIAFVNAIEVFTAPADFIDVANSKTVNLGGQNIDQLSKQPLESVYRINVGGPRITPANDTLWRTWIPDDDYIFNIFLSLKNSTTQQIKYGVDPRDTEEIAPESVYNTARTMNVSDLLRQSNPNFNLNLTWSFQVLPGSTYFIRMHFCDFLQSPNLDQLYFDVYIGDLLAYPDLQPAALRDATPAAALYIDFVANSTDSTLMNVSIGRSTRSTQFTANALLNGLEIMKVGLSSNSESQNNSGGGVSIAILVPSIIVGLVLIAGLISIVVWVCRRRRQPKTLPKPKESPMWSPFSADGKNSALSLSSNTDRTTNTASPTVNLGLHIPLIEIKFATNSFDESFVIGTGGFGKVYRGVLRDGTKVAVKRATSESRQGNPEFQTEIVVLSQIRHRHLVSLIGYCDERSEMILVYEYMEKGPLKNHLYGSNLPCLSWKQRLEICISAARGLHYLHTGYSDNIIHRDVKSTNILLGEDYLAKVSDFGLSRLGPSLGETHVSTVVKGTFGYLDPEYFKIQKLTDKSDVYSFGVMLFEVLCARPVIDQKLSRDRLNLAEWALVMQRKGQLEKIIDPRLKGKINLNSLRKFGESAEKCLAEYGVDRPTIGDVLWNLEYALQLQETELRREPFEDSGNVELQQIPVNAVGRLPSNSITVDHEEEEEEEYGLQARMNEGHTGVTSSTVFSQLMTDDGR